MNIWHCRSFAWIGSIEFAQTIAASVSSKQTTVAVLSQHCTSSHILLNKSLVVDAASAPFSKHFKTKLVDKAVQNVENHSALLTKLLWQKWELDLESTQPNPAAIKAQNASRLVTGSTWIPISRQVNPMCEELHFSFRILFLSGIDVKMLPTALQRKGVSWHQSPWLENCMHEFVLWLLIGTTSASNPRIWGSHWGPWSTHHIYVGQPKCNITKSQHCSLSQNLKTKMMSNRLVVIPPIILKLWKKTPPGPWIQTSL